MSTVFEGTSDIFGGAPNNAHFQAHGTDMRDPINSAQLTNSYDMNNNALNGQQNLAAQLAGQNGMQNQQDVYGQQQQLANSLQMQVQGQGPNPAQQMLANQTGNNIAAQNAMMASQRGSSANTGLLGRQASMQGANIQQQAVGQGALMQANQQLAAQQQLMGQQQAMQGVAGSQIGNQMNAQNAYTQNTLGNQNQFIGANQGFNNALLGNQSNSNNVNAAMAQTNANNTAGAIGGMFKGLQSAAMPSAPSMAQGGMVQSNQMDPQLSTIASIYHGQNYDDGGYVNLGSPNAIGNGSPLAADANYTPAKKSGGDPSSAAQDNPFGEEGMGGAMAGAGEAEGGGSALGLLALANRGGVMRGGKQVQAMVSPGEVYVPPKEVSKVASGKESIAEAGKKVPGKANVKGDSLKNDTVPAKLEEGGIVIPRSVLDSDDPMKAGTEFLKNALRKSGKKGNEESDFKKALQSAIKSRGEK